MSAATVGSLPGLPTPDREWVDHWGRPHSMWRDGHEVVDVELGADGIYRATLKVDGRTFVASAEYRTARGVANWVRRWM